MTVTENRGFIASGLARAHWSNATPIRTIFREAFEAAGLSYFDPHSLRKTLTSLGQQLCQTPEEFKAWSQNLGHDEVMTTLYSYGHVQQQRQGEIIQHLKFPRNSSTHHIDEIALAVVRAIGNKKIAI